MALKRIQHRLPDVLRETITSLCRNMVEFQNELTVEGLIGVTLDSSQIFLVSINEQLKKGSHNKVNSDRVTSPVTIEDTPKKEKHDKKEKKKRRIEELEAVEEPAELPSNNEKDATLVDTEAKSDTPTAPVQEPLMDVSLDTSLEIPPEFKDDGMQEKSDENTQDKTVDYNNLQPQDDTAVNADEETHIDNTEDQVDIGDDVCETDGKPETAMRAHDDDTDPLEVLQNECKQLESNLKISSVWSDSPSAVEMNDEPVIETNIDAEAHGDESVPRTEETQEHSENQRSALHHVSTHGFEVLEENDDMSANIEKVAEDSAVPSCSKDTEVAEENNGDEVEVEQSTPVKKRRKSESSDSSYRSSGQSDSDDDSDEKTKKSKRKKIKSSTPRKASEKDKETHADSPQSTGSEVEFVAMDTESSSKDGAKKKGRKSRDNEDLIILDDESRDKSKKKKSDLDVNAMIAGIVKTTMGNMSVKGGPKVPQQTVGPVRALGTITPVSKSAKNVQIITQQLTCQFCGHKFNNMRLLTQHRQMDKCTICGGLFNCPTMRFNHVVRDHQNVGAGMIAQRGGRGRSRGQRGTMGGFGMTPMVQPIRPVSTQMPLTSFMNMPPSTSTSGTSSGRNFRVVTAKKCKECGGLYSMNDFERHQVECPALVSRKKKKHMCPCGIGFRHSKNFNAHISECTIAQAIGTSKIAE